MSNRVVPENTVLVAASIWLRKERKCEIFFCSPPRGRGLNYERNADQLKDALVRIGVSSDDIHIRPEGEDILTISREMREIWHVECKGAGTGKPSTYRNQFDRVLSSIVSHYTGSFTKDGVKINYALALPKTKIYVDLLQKRVQKPLREQLNLWVLVLSLDPLRFYAISPGDDYPEFE